MDCISSKNSLLPCWIFSCVLIFYIMYLIWFGSNSFRVLFLVHSLGAPLDLAFLSFYLDLAVIITKLCCRGCRDNGRLSLDGITLMSYFEQRVRNNNIYIYIYIYIYIDPSD